MKVKIQRNQIHHFKEPELDASGNPTGGELDMLQMDIKFTEYSDLPTYGIRVDFTNLATKPEIKDAIKAQILALVDRVNIQIQRDEAARQNFEDWGWLEEFDTDSF